MDYAKDQWMKLVIMCYAMLIQNNHKLKCDINISLIKISSYKLTKSINLLIVIIYIHINY